MRALTVSKYQTAPLWRRFHLSRVAPIAYAAARQFASQRPGPHARFQVLRP